MYAFAYRSGLIGFGRRCPRNTLTIASGPGHIVRKVVTAKARHSRTNDDLLVPGIPEAVSDQDALNALIAFANRCRAAMGPADAIGQVETSRPVLEGAR